MEKLLVTQRFVVNGADWNLDKLREETSWS